MTTTDDDRDKNAIAFWQKEVHFYQTRAGAQGDAAIRMVPLAAGATALIPIIGAVLLPASNSPALATSTPDFRWTLLVLPIAILLLWATAVRLLHEMEVLRAYAAHAELRLRNLTADVPTLAPYLPWEGKPSERLGATYDKPRLLTLSWLAAVLVLSAAGALLLPWVVAYSITSEWVTALAVVVPFAIVAVFLAIAFARNGRDRSEVLERLLAGTSDNPDEPSASGDPAAVSP